MPLGVTDDDRQLADAVRAWARRVQPITTVRAQAEGSADWRELWPAVVEFGATAAAVPEATGGGGAGLIEHAALLEAAAGALVPGPLLTGALTALVLAEAGDEAAGCVASGDVPAGVALDGGDLTAEPESGGTVRVRGVARRVLGADASGVLLLPARSGGDEAWVLVEQDATAVKVLELEPVDPSRSIAEVHLESAVGRIVAIPSGRVRDLAATLAAAEAAGVAAWCLQTAVEYAKAREQFGRTIGSFQSIKHLCAQMLCRVEVSAAVAWDAAAAAGDSAEHPVAAAVAASLALDGAVDTAKDCIQVLGGIGFTWEHDAHLYLRRALALRQWLGGSAAWRRRLAELTVDGARRTLRIALGDTESIRDEVRGEAERIAALPEPRRRAALADSGLLMPHWPKPYGRDADAAEQLLIDEELARAGVTRPDLVIAGWAIPTILEHGTPEQIERFVRPTLAGEITWCQLFSEPDAGSDLASLRTKAERVDGGWRITGQKVWTSLAHKADWGICLARTDSEAPKHKGISYFLVDMRSDGVDIRPLREIIGEPRFNEVFLDGVFVPDDCLVGRPGDGWKLARTTLGHERVAIGSASSIGDETEQLVSRVREHGLLADALVADKMGGLIANGIAGSLLDVRATLRRMGGSSGGAESSVRKLLGVAHRQQLADLALELAGTDGLARCDVADSVLVTRCLSIAGGTTQVLLSVVAERLLGLPRD